jgi:hypothetical protein
MKTITNTVAIQGNAAAVFDLVTTTRFWTAWHPATTGVGGVTERPFQLGDKIRERAQIGARVHEGTWTVVTHDRPRCAVLRMESGRILITYSFHQTDNLVHFARTLEYHPEDFVASVPDPVMLEKVMFTQSEQALQKLKRLVEEILAEEAMITIKPEA